MLEKLNGISPDIVNYNYRWAPSFDGDMAKYNTAALLGWRVFRCTPSTLLSESTLLLLKNAINGKPP